MKRLATLTAGLILGSPALALAAEHSASYRGIGLIYFTFIAGILIYGVYDAFGKKAMYVATPIILAWSYWMLPPTCRATWRTEAPRSDGRGVCCAMLLSLVPLPPFQIESWQATLTLVQSSRQCTGQTHRDRFLRQENQYRWAKFEDLE